jgi:hypothetical protein
VIRGLMTDDEWAIFEPFLTTPSPQGGRPPSDDRRVLDGILRSHHENGTDRLCGEAGP